MVIFQEGLILANNGIKKSSLYEMYWKRSWRVKKSLPEDIITDGTYMGIISGPNKTLSASSLTNIVVENDWGWREE